MSTAAKSMKPKQTTACIYRNLPRHRAVSLRQHGLLSVFSQHTLGLYNTVRSHNILFMVAVSPHCSPLSSCSARS